MARVQYGSFVTALAGSVGGSTYQKNASGEIVKNRVSRVSSPTSRQVIPKSQFLEIVDRWNNLTFSQKSGWNTFAAANSYVDYWGRSKTLTGYSWFLSLNSNLLNISLATITTAPASISPVSVPSFSVTANSTSLQAVFSPSYTHTGATLLLFASPPLTGASLQQRKSLRLVKVISSSPSSTINFKSDWESYFPFSWPASTVSGSFGILVSISSVNQTTGYASPFTSVIGSFVSP